MDWLASFSIKRKLMAVMLVFGFAGCAILVDVVNSTAAVEQRFNEYDQAAVSSQKYLLSINRDMNYVSRLSRSIMLGDDFSKNYKLLETRIQDIYNHFEGLDTAISAIDNDESRSEIRQLADLSQQATEAFLEDGRNRMLALKSVERSPEVLQQAWAEYRVGASPFANEARRTFRDLTEAEEVLRVYIQAEAAGALSSMRLQLCAITLGSFALAGLILLFVSRTILRTVDSMRLSITSIEADSDLTRRIHITSQDELGQLSRSFNLMLDKFQTSLQSVAETSASLAESSQGMAAITADSASSVQTQRDELEMVATAMNEMTATVVEVAKNANDAADAAVQTDTQSQAGLTVVNNTVQTIEGLAVGIERASQVVKDLEDDSHQIGSILDVIKGIAEQTNLLALNAAIEAARAGEQGRGFAVVADEVRTLASRTQESTEEIQRMIEKLQGGAKLAADAMSDSRQYVDDSVNHARSAGEVLQSIAKAIATITDMNTQIATAAEEQSTVSEEINTNIVNISNAAEETAAGTMSSSQESENLAQMAKRLSGLVQEFKI
ncbi:methyl-accepting chemotaxis protein [Shewanella pealeana]|uniref:Methyl-accepting chemotaxis sensory transducer n=1 Tax=Shewanella pealeana (strain ATCC 700345 / ANG-SQ1) TaxID=398579 RepID=A8HAB9_SHEPA|nr:methyl-accepting chemotaxis protein [Shewanella pealeana]ABV89506.1 methyl-accepting chemotaxis sensory transducer [Shewanella pealeana ATCC 700345]